MESFLIDELVVHIFFLKKRTMIVLLILYTKESEGEKTINAGFPLQILSAKFEKKKVDSINKKKKKKPISKNKK